MKERKKILMKDGKLTKEKKNHRKKKGKKTYVYNSGDVLIGRGYVCVFK